jgi:hypothetical protein
VRRVVGKASLLTERMSQINGTFSWSDSRGNQCHVQSRSDRSFGEDDQNDRRARDSTRVDEELVEHHRDCELDEGEVDDSAISNRDESTAQGRRQSCTSVKSRNVRRERKKREAKMHENGRAVKTASSGLVVS